MNTKWIGAGLLAFLSVSVAPTFTSAQTTAATGASSSTPPLVSVQKLSGDIYEFNYLLTTGPGKYHQVGVHRVVRVEDGKPIVSHNAVFLAHGDGGSFNAAFMDGTTSPESIPVYLAKYGIDVWGIDYGWSLVPLAETDFSFMQNWGLQRDIDDLEQALEFARDVRKRMGSNGARLTLLGYSLSGWTGFALLSQETQKQCASRQVKAFIPVDAIFNSNDPISQATGCAGEAFLRQYGIDLGYYDDNTGAGLQLVGAYAATDPNGTSPLVPPYTNLQALLIEGAATWQFAQLFPPFAHSVAGKFGASGINGLPTGFHYTSVSRFANVMKASAPYEPVELELETDAIGCGDGRPEFSNHLGQIRVPVFHVGAGGGAAKYGLYTLTQLGSDDISHHIVSFYPPSQVALDYGHYDLFTARNAQDVVWSRILAWLMSHDEDNSCSAN
jgi:hypothetical protein